MAGYELILSIADLAAPRTVRLSPNEIERQDIAARLGLVGLPAFTAEVTVTPLKKNHRLQVTGRVEADVTQECVVTLEPFDSRITTDFDELHDRDADLLGTEDDDAPFDQAADIPEFLEGETLDLADIAVQHLSLALEPFPRKPDTSLDVGGRAGVSANEAERDNPFAALAALKGEKQPD